MIKLFNRKKVSLNSISIPDFSWPQEQNNPKIKQWINPERSVALMINFFDLVPDLPTVRDENLLRHFFRNQLKASGNGIVQADIIDLKGYKAVKNIYKVPQDPTGMTYLASIVIPFTNCSYVIRVQGMEVGTTGMRDSSVLARLMSEKKLTMGEKGVEGWFKDPYDAELTEGLLMNLSEAEAYDSEFPHHPLSKVWKLMRQIEADIEFGKELEKLGRFQK